MTDAAAKIIMGRGGERVNEISRTAGSKIQVRRGFPLSEFTLRGKYEDAHKLICQILLESGCPLDGNLMVQKQ